MSALAHSVYRLTDGLFTGARVTCAVAGESEAALAVVQAFLLANTPAGCALVEGVHDPLAEMVDLATGAIVSRSSSPPASDELQTWEWSEDAQRWRSVPTVAGRKPAMVGLAEQLMAAREAAQQHRPVRELLLAVLAGGTPDSESLDRLAADEAYIAGLRAMRAGIVAATTHEALDDLQAQLDGML